MKKNREREREDQRNRYRNAEEFDTYWAGKQATC